MDVPDGHALTLNPRVIQILEVALAGGCEAKQRAEIIGLIETELRIAYSAGAIAASAQAVQIARERFRDG